MRNSWLLLIPLLILALPIAGSTADNGAAEPPARLGLGAHAGHVVYVDFWASWCVPCRQSFAWMNDMHDKYGESGLVIIAVNVDADQNAAAKFLEKYPASFRLLYDHENQLARHYDLPAMPTSYLYDRDGRFRESHIGFREGDGAELERAIRELLKETADE